jgi:hypothetical protein
MVGLIISIILFNIFAFKTNKHLNKNQILHIWLYTISLQAIFDTYIDLKYQGYWYFSKGVDWASLLNLIFLVPPVNMAFLNWYPHNASFFKKLRYIFYCEIFLLSYELFTLSPEPYGFFHYGWWNLGYSALLNPFLLLSLLAYYKIILRIERGINK